MSPVPVDGFRDRIAPTPRELVRTFREMEQQRWRDAMSDEKPSPGPWHIDGYRIRDRYSDDVVALGPGVGFDGTRDDANARLIAAAPEMLELVRDWYIGRGEGPTRTANESLADEMRANIEARLNWLRGMLERTERLLFGIGQLPPDRDESPPPASPPEPVERDRQRDDDDQGE